MKDRYKNFTRLILNISRCIQKIKNTQMQKLGFKGNQVELLFALSKIKDGLTLTELANYCGEDKAAISRSIKNLSNSGIVFVEETENQTYKNKIKLTKQGEKIGNFITNKIDEMVRASSEGIGEGEREIFYNVLEKISCNLTKIESGESVW